MLFLNPQSAKKLPSPDHGISIYYFFIRMHHQPTALPGFCKSHWVSPERHRACGRPWACDAPGAPSHRDDGFMIDRLPVTKYDLSVLE